MKNIKHLQKKWKKEGKNEKEVEMSETDIKNHKERERKTDDK